MFPPCGCGACTRFRSPFDVPAIIEKIRRKLWLANGRNTRRSESAARAYRVVSHEKTSLRSSLIMVGLKGGFEAHQLPARSTAWLSSSPGYPANLRDGDHTSIGFSFVRDLPVDRTREAALHGFLGLLHGFERTIGLVNRQSLFAVKNVVSAFCVFSDRNVRHFRYLRISVSGRGLHPALPYS